MARRHRRLDTEQAACKSPLQWGLGDFRQGAQCSVSLVQLWQENGAEVFKCLHGVVGLAHGQKTVHVR